MLQLNTRHFGDIDISEDKIINFNTGLPGFPELRRFSLIVDPAELDKQTAVFYWLQSLDDTDIAFCLVDLAVIMPEYNPLVDESEFEGLGSFNSEHFLIYNMAVIPENAMDMTVNMKAPVVINSQLMLGRQVICQNEGYAIKHYLFK